MVKPSDLLKIFLVIHFLEFCFTLPLGDEANYESGVVSVKWHGDIN